MMKHRQGGGVCWCCSVVVIHGDGDMVGLVIAQGQDASHHPQGHRIIKRSPALDDDFGAGNQTHLPHPEAKLAANFYGRNDPGLIFFHLSQIYFSHVDFGYLLWGMGFRCMIRIFIAIAGKDVKNSGSMSVIP